MSPADLFIFRFLLASCGCMAAGLGVWSVTTLCRRWLPGVALQRSIWLLGQVTIVAAFLLILLPHSERLRLVPPIDLAEVTATRAAAPASTAAPESTPLPANAAVADAAVRSWLLDGARAWLLVYLLGLAVSIVRQLQARRTLNRLAAAGGCLPALDQHDGFAGTPAPTPEVIEVDAPISPMLFGLFRPRLLLPLHLRSFEATQQQMIVAHELTHLRRRDLHWISAGVLLQTLLWFNPFMRLLRIRLSWAQELGCDRDVLRGRPAAQRKAYAAALVAQLKLPPSPAAGALAFGGASANTLAGRIALIRDPAAARQGRWTRAAAACGLTCILAASLAFQPALTAAQPAALATFSCTELADAASGTRLLREGQCDERVTPASTFNIAVSLMGYDSGFLADEHTPALPFRQGYADWNPDWRATTDPASWLKYSVVWFAQQITTRLGVARFQDYVDSFNYGNRDLRGDAGKDNGLAMSWIASSLKISPAEQVDFLRNMVNRQLPVSEKAYDMTSRIMPSQTLDNGWVVHGKTGTASPVLADGSDDPERQYGWYVGWASKGERTVVFARLVLDRKQQAFAGWRVKEAFLRDLAIRLDTL
jgi:beta-lactamase class D/beta-lactamase regulating signal transducer with metallopeptidase domain